MVSSISRRGASARILKNAILVLLSLYLRFPIADGCLTSTSGNFNRYVSFLDNHFLQFPRHLCTVKEYARLSRDVIPLNYDITLKPHLDLETFYGLVKISINISKPTQKIVLHGNNIAVLSAILNDLNNVKVSSILNVEENKLCEIIKFTFKEEIKPGIYIISVEYSGLYGKSLGLYKSSHQINNRTVNRFIATTQFEPTYARQTYPCFDEPNFKATFTVHLLKPNDRKYVALSNNPAVYEERQDDGVMVHFKETVPMSTYLSCFIVCDFIHVETYFRNGDKLTPLRVYASPGQKNKIEYAAKVGKKMIEYFIKYFKLPYPLPKLDMVAIPDFSSSAMENWGLATFRENSLFYTDKTHSVENKQRVASVIGHELAHSWFGNIVTINWWDNLWLNEGFAAYMEFKGVENAEPSWKFMNQFILKHTHQALRMDACKTSHSIIQNVSTPDQINAVFDNINYDKGATLLRMLENTVGEDNFRIGVTNYLNKFKYKNAVSSNLYNEIQAVIGNSINITTFMNTFTIQKGYPILELAQNGNQYIIKQKRFLSNPEESKEDEYSPFQYKWSIPITYLTDKGKSDVIWFHYDSPEVSINRPIDVVWMKFNAGQIGYYRVNYSKKDWKSLIRNIHKLPSTDRAHLLEESFSIAAAGEINFSIPLEMAKYLVNEYDYLPWHVAGRKLIIIAHLLNFSKYFSQYREYVLNLLQPAYDHFTWNEDKSDGHLRKLARSEVLLLACTIGHEEALEIVMNKFVQWIDGKEEISPNVRDIIYRYGTQYADDVTWYKVFAKFVETDDSSEKKKLLAGLASVRQRHLIIELINLTENGNYIRDQDYLILLVYLSKNPIGTSIVWDYVREKWPMLVDRFSLSSRPLGRLIPAITASFSTKEKLQEFPNAGAGYTARLQALERVESNIKSFVKYARSIELWIQNNANTF